MFLILLLCFFLITWFVFTLLQISFIQKYSSLTLLTLHLLLVSALVLTGSCVIMISCWDTLFLHVSLEYIRTNSIAIIPVNLNPCCYVGRLVMGIDSLLCQYFCQLLPPVVFVSGMKCSSLRKQAFNSSGGHVWELCVHVRDRDTMAQCLGCARRRRRRLLHRHSKIELNFNDAASGAKGHKTQKASVDFFNLSFALRKLHAFQPPCPWGEVCTY